MKQDPANGETPDLCPAGHAPQGSPQDALVSVRKLSKEFKLGRRGLWGDAQTRIKAVEEVSFDIRRGGTFGLVGESGCGKSTVARCVLRLLRPTAGEVRFDEIALEGLSPLELRKLRRRMQIVFQDPYASLDPKMSVREILEEPLLIHERGGRDDRLSRVQEILSLVGLSPEDLQKRPFAFSGGQRQRIGIARALVLNPEFVVLDEPVSALDVSIQAQILNLLRSLQEKSGLTYLFIVHDLVLAEYFCDRLAVLYLGRVMEIADRQSLFRNPLHPYTTALLSAVPTPDSSGQSRGSRIILKGEVETRSAEAKGCRFRSRCPVGWDREICQEVEPPLAEMEPGHWTACHFAGEEAGSQP